jgi:hypothetical protein
MNTQQLIDRLKRSGFSVVHADGRLSFNANFIYLSTKEVFLSEGAMSFVQTLDPWVDDVRTIRYDQSLGREPRTLRLYGNFIVFTDLGEMTILGTSLNGVLSGLNYRDD